MTQQFFAIATTMHARGEAHSQYRAELVFTMAEDADAALGALRSQIAQRRPGWEIVSTAIRVVPKPPEPKTGDPTCT